MGNMIVKIQQSLESSDDIKVIMIYNEDRSFQEMSDDPVTIKPLLKMLGNRPKAYFKVKEDKNTLSEFGLVILDEVEAPGW